jgi:hypothetical protein
VVVASLLHFSKLEAKVELLGSGHNVALMEDEVDVLWALAHPASDLLASHVLPSVARGPPMVQRSSSGGSLRHCSFALVYVRKTLMNGKIFCKIQAQLPPIILSLHVCWSCRVLQPRELW